MVVLTCVVLFHKKNVNARDVSVKQTNLGEEHKIAPSFVNVVHDSSKKYAGQLRQHLAFK